MNYRVLRANQKAPTTYKVHTEKCTNMVQNCVKNADESISS
jgi:hypothetical protein